MRSIDAEKLCEEFKRRQKAALNWKQQAIMNENLESEIRADAVLGFLSEVKLTIDKAPTIEPKAEWIPINEETIKILQDHHYYLVAHKDFKTPMKAKYHNDSFKHFEVFSFKSSQISYIFLNSTDDITHFMELPELPKEEEGEK